MEVTEGSKITGEYSLHGAMCNWKVWNNAVVNGAWLQVWGGAGIDLPGTPEIGKWYRMEIEATGNKVSFYVDGKLLFEREDDSHPSGGIALWAYDAIVEFDNVVITGDDIPDLGPSGYAVEPRTKLVATWGWIRR